MPFIFSIYLCLALPAVVRVIFNSRLFYCVFFYPPFLTVYIIPFERLNVNTKINVLQNNKIRVAL